MTDYAAVRDKNRCPAHPGALLREILSSTSRSKTEIAALLGISRQHFYDILREKKPVSATTAVRLGKLFGNDGGLWLRMQTAHDLWKAAKTVDVSAIPTIGTAA